MFRDKNYRYRNIEIFEKNIPKRCLAYEEWKKMGVSLSSEWENYEFNPINNNILLFRQKIENEEEYILNITCENIEMKTLPFVNYEFLYTQEQKNTITFINIGEESRMILVNYLIRVCSKNNINLETLCLGVKIFDKFMSKSEIEDSKLKFFSLVCLNIAYKFICFESFEIDGGDVLESELLVLSKISFSIWCPTVFNFLNFKDLFNEKQKLLESLVKITLANYSLLFFNPSIIAKACMYFLNEENDIDEQTGICIQKIQKDAENIGLDCPKKPLLSPTKNSKNIIKPIPLKPFPVNEEYKIVEKLGQGSYGTVYLGKNSIQNVALKKITEEDCLSSSTIREIGILRELDHPNIIKILDIMVKRNSIYIIMEVLPTTLKKVLENQRLSLYNLKHILKGILSGLDYLHSHNILHRDIKPENILINKTEIKLIDFGLSKPFYENKGAHTPLVCTMWYRCPELLLGTKEYGSAIDIWSVGCVMGEIINDKPLFPQDSEISQLFCIFNKLGTWKEGCNLPHFRNSFPKWPKKDISELVPYFKDTEGLDLLAKMLEYNPEKRISAKEALKHAFLN